MGLNVLGLVAEPIKDVATSAMDNARQVKISNNMRDVQLDNNRLSAFQTASNNKLTAFVTALNTGMNIITGLISIVNTGMQVYAQVTESHEQTRRVQLQADAYTRGKQEDTRQVQIQQEQETVRYLSGLKNDLETKHLELKKFEQELNEQRDAREFSQEQWRRKVTAFEGILNPVLEHAKKIREAFEQSNFTDENLWEKLQQLDEKLYAYSLQLNEIYK